MEKEPKDNLIVREVYKKMIREGLTAPSSASGDAKKEKELFERLYNEKLAEKKRLEEEAKKTKRP